MVAILVVLTIVLFVAADLAVQRVRARRAAPAKAAAGASPTDLILPGLQPERFALPAGLFFHPGHTWVNLLFSGHVKVGVDDFLQKLLGRVDAITLPPQGVEVKAGEPFAVLHQGARRLALVAPVSGVVAAVNAELAKAPRQADGSLPANGFARLVAGSDLIDQGVDVGIPYLGAAPDLGAFECW